MGCLYFPQYRKGRDGVELFEGTLLEHAQKLGVEIASECGGLGTCGRCVVRIERGEGALSDRTAAEREFNLGENERLACQASVIDTSATVRVFMKDFGNYSILSDSMEDKIDLDPFVHQEGRRVVHDESGDLGAHRGEIYGLAIDVGTTTVVVELVDLEDGRRLATLSRKNPQIAYGNDVISRIGYTMEHEGGLKQLQKVVVNGINELLAQHADETGEFRDRVYEVVIVGNSTMRDIFFGQKVESLGVIPYEAGNLDPLHATARQIGLRVNPSCQVYGPALIGGHAGSDALADIIAAGMHLDDAVNVMIDIGTNGEVAIGNSKKMMTASCAAGGAYEGATVSCGTGAIEGAIKNVWLHNGRVDYETIGNKPAVGVCGSGLIDLLAELLRTETMSRKAKLRDDFEISEKIKLTQEDIYELITAKAGLRADQDLLMKYYGVDISAVQRMYLAGGFGNFINVENAALIGLLPDAASKTARIGNAALAGARAMLLSKSTREESEELARSIEHAKPNEREPDFPYIVAENMYF
ncbi:MAG: ASKHA domain-containing protein [Candidatus Brocadiia bacterium]